MSSEGQRLAQAALGLVGIRYRLLGHHPDSGLDCVGLLVASLERIGRTLEIPRRYSMRNRTIDMFLQLAEQPGVAVAKGTVCAGDIQLVQPGPAQHHILIATGPSGFVHAHAALRRVVIHPAPNSWPLLRQWRLTDLDK